MTNILYGKSYITMPCKAAVLSSNVDKLKSCESGTQLVRRAMASPIASKTLKELAKDKKTCTFIISDHTRPVPSRDIVPLMLSELREGNPDIDITLLVATGLHRNSEKSELRDKLGDEIFENEKIVVHDGRDPEQNVEIGELPSGAKLEIDKLAAETDLLVAEGFIEPHFFAGFSGGRKSVLPGVSGKVTVLGNHCSKFIDNPLACTGNLEGNPIHTDMIAAAKMAKLAYIVNVVIDEDKKTVAAFAGDAIKAHEAGCEFLNGYCQVNAVPADIVVTSNGGAPLDQNIYQCVKGLTAAEATAKPGAVLIICAALGDGHGAQAFYDTMCNCESAEKLYEEIMATPQDETIFDQWQSQILARVLIKHKVIFVCPEADKDLVLNMKMSWAETLEEAISMAKAEKGENASVTAIPNGVSVIVKKA